MKHIVLSIILTGGLLSSGCASLSRKQQTEHLQENTKALYSNAKANLASGRAIASGSTEPIDAAEQSLAKEIADSDAKYAAMRQELEEQRKQLNEYLTATLLTVAELAPGGTLASKAARSLLTKFDSADSATEDIRKENAELKKAAETAALESSRAIEKLKNESALEVQRIQTQLAANAEQTKNQIALLEQTFKNLTSEQKAAFKEELINAANEAGLSEREVEELKSKSPEDLLALFGGGGIALAALLRTFGRSRSQTEINELYDKTVELEKAIQNKANKPA